MTVALDVVSADLVDVFDALINGTTWERIEARPRLVSCAMVFARLAIDARKSNRCGVAEALDAIDTYLIRLAGKAEFSGSDFLTAQRLSERLDQEISIDPR